MNPRLTILIASLTVNVLLVAAVVRVRPARKFDPPASPSPTLPPEAGAPARPASEPVAKVESASVLAPTAFHWRELEAEDYARYIANLRAFGVPGRIIRDIIMADVDKLYRPKFAALRGPRKERKYWERYSYYSSRASQSPEQREQERALSKEKSELIKTLLGSDVFEQINRESGQPDWKQRMWGGLDEAKRAPAEKIWEKFNEARSAIYDKAGGYVDSDVQNDLRELSRKVKAELATVLTPQEIEEFELRNSDTASNMRYQLKYFTPDEAEFRAVFRYQQAMEDLRMSPGTDGSRPDAQAMKQIQEQRKQAEAALAAALPPDRLKEFKLNDDYAFNSLFQMGLNRNDVLKVAEMKKSAEEASARLRVDKSVAAEQRTAALNAIRMETERELDTLMGDRKSKYYRNSGGFWLRNLAPTPSP